VSSVLQNIIFNFTGDATTPRNVGGHSPSSDVHFRFRGVTHPRADQTSHRSQGLISGGMPHRNDRMSLDLLRVQILGLCAGEQLLGATDLRDRSPAWSG